MTMDALLFATFKSGQLLQDVTVVIRFNRADCRNALPRRFGRLPSSEKSSSGTADVHKVRGCVWVFGSV